MATLIFLAFLLFIGRGADAELICKDLPVGMCSYSTNSSRYRCVLETFTADDETTILQCKKSQVLVNSLNECIESDHYIKACGLDRFSVGISTDSLADAQSVRSLCSLDCYQNCPNIIDLYNNLPLAEVSLNELCKINQLRSRAAAAVTRKRVMQHFKSSAASGPSCVSADPLFADAESPLSTTDCPPPAETPGEL